MEDNAGFRPLQEDSSVIKYAGTLSLFIWFLVQQALNQTDPRLRLYNLQKAILVEIGDIVNTAVLPDNDPDPSDLEERLPTLVSNLLCSLFQTTVSAKVSEWIYPPMNYLAFSMVKEDGSYDHLAHLSHRIAVLQYSVRLAFAEQFLSTGTHREEWDPSSDPRDAPGDDWGNFPWLHKGTAQEHGNRTISGTPKITGCFNCLRQLMQLITTLVRSEAMPETTCWADTELETLQIDDFTITITGIRNCIHSIQKKAGDELQHLLEGCKMPPFDTSLYKDKPNATEVDFNYLVHSSLTHDQYDQHLIKEWMTRKDPHSLIKPSWQKCFSLVSDGNEDVIWNKANFRPWLQKADEFLEKLYFLYHVASGQPIRGTEEQSTLLVNSETAPRNIFWRGNNFVIMTWYHKGQNQTGFSKPRMTFLPPRHSQWWHYYLGFIRPTMV